LPILEVRKIDSRLGSLLSQREGCGCWPEATTHKTAVRTSLASKRKNRREKRMRQISTFRPEDSARRGEESAFLCSQSIASHVLPEYPALLCWAKTR
jgi:hypothetical protein